MYSSTICKQSIFNKLNPLLYGGKGAETPPPVVFCHILEKSPRQPMYERFLVFPNFLLRMPL